MGADVPRSIVVDWAENRLNLPASAVAEVISLRCIHALKGMALAPARSTNCKVSPRLHEETNHHRDNFFFLSFVKEFLRRRLYLGSDPLGKVGNIVSQIAR